MKSKEKVAKHIVNWLVNYSKKHNMQGFVVGVSGGIDCSNFYPLCENRLKITLFRNANQTTIVTRF